MNLRNIVLLICLLSLPLSAPSANEGEPARPVERFHAVLLEVMKGDELAFPERYEIVAAGLDENFDMTFMARSALGSSWKKLDEGQRQIFVDLSKRLSATRYADNFDGFGGQRFETRSEAPAGRGTVFVKTEFVQPEDDPVKFDYRLRKTDGEWRIIDVLLNGQISEVALRRAQFRSILDKEGFDGLVAAIEEKIAEFAQS